MSFSVNDQVSFKPGPKATGPVTAQVTGTTETGFLVTKDAAGVERKVRPGSCTLVPAKGKKAA